MKFSMIKFINADISTKPRGAWVGTKIAQVDKPTLEELFTMMSNHLIKHEEQSLTVFQGSAKHNYKDRFDRKLGAKLATERLKPVKYVLNDYYVHNQGLDMTFISDDNQYVFISHDDRHPNKYQIHFTFTQG